MKKQRKFRQSSKKQNKIRSNPCIHQKNAVHLHRKSPKGQRNPLQ